MANSKTCPGCSNAIPNDSRFCPQCGASQTFNCAACGRSNPAGSRFCAQCGVKLGDAAPAQPAAPPAAAPRAGSAAERRQLTVMFCDLVGSTALSTRLDPEDLREVIASYHKHATEVVGRFGGYVAKYMGDGVLVYFGYPSAHESDAENAVRAGLALLEPSSSVRRPPASDPNRHRHRPGGGRRAGRRRRGAGAQRRRRDAEPRRAPAVRRRAEHGRDRRQHPAAHWRRVRIRAD